MTDQTAWVAFEIAAIGTLLTAGADSFVKRGDTYWHRASDDSTHTSHDLADFHGHSGYTLVAPSRELDYLEPPAGSTTDGE